MSIPFYGQHQAGVATPAQNYLQFVAFDVVTESHTDVRDLLGAWTQAAAALTAGRSLGPSAGGDQPPVDPGEAVGLSAANLTITFGFGPTLFEHRGRDRFGLRSRKPPELEPLPPFCGEDLNPAKSAGDLCIQACADDPQVAFHAIHALAGVGSSAVTMRWTQAGFGPTSTRGRAPVTPRNLMGFKDGTNNIKPHDAGAVDRFVWLGADARPSWLRGGTYLVARRIRMLLDVWDATSLEEQQRTIGRQKQSGAPLGSHDEHDPVNLNAESGGSPVIPADAHIRLASRQTNGNQRLLRRGYSYADGYDPATGQLDAGLFFIAFQRSPGRQFIPIQQRLAESDALNHHTLHTSSAIFAVPPGVRQGGSIGDSLL